MGANFAIDAARGTHSSGKRCDRAFQISLPLRQSAADMNNEMRFSRTAAGSLSSKRRPN
jgi:hypothetical protein